MRKIVLLTVSAALGVVGVAHADKPSHPPHPPQAQNGTPGHPNKSNPRSCATHAEGFNAVGSLVSASLTSATGRHRYSGTIVVEVARVNHHGANGEQSFKLTNARVFFHHGVNALDPPAGSRVDLHGKVTELSKPCSTSSFSPSVTVRDVDIHKAKTAKK